MRWMILAALVLGTCQSATAQSRQFFVSGNDLYEVCQTKSADCVGFITGVADALEALPASMRGTCRPKGVALEQVLDFAVQTLRDNPTTRHEPAFDLLAKAFVETWPC